MPTARYYDPHTSATSPLFPSIRLPVHSSSPTLLAQSSSHSHSLPPCARPAPSPCALRPFPARPFPAAPRSPIATTSGEFSAGGNGERGSSGGGGERRLRDTPGPRSVRGTEAVWPWLWLEVGTGERLERRAGPAKKLWMEVGELGAEGGGG